MVRVLTACALTLGVLGCSDRPPAARATPSSAPPSSEMVAPSPAATPVLAPITVSPTPRPTPSRRAVSLSTSGVAGVPFGTPDRDAERRLRRALGPPLSEPLPDCDGIQGRTLSWGSLDVVLSDEDGGSIVLVGWSVSDRPRASFLYDLPYGVQLGTPMRSVLTKVPRSEGYPVDEGPFTGDYVVRTAEEPYVFWRSRQGDGSGRVDEISFQTASLGCD